MTCTDYEIDLGDYVDGTLDGSARTACEAHLSACERCRALVTDLRTIRQASLALEPGVPAPHVWIALSAAVEARRAGGLGRWGFSWRSLAATSVTAMLVASLSWVGARLVPVNEQAGRLAARTTGQASSELPSIEREFNDAEAQFTSAISGLQAVTNADQSVLDMDTADVLRANLTVIDGAIVESRAALTTEPSSQVAQESLFEALRNKIELLQDMVALINEMRKGNSDGAARIMSGLNQ